MSLIFRQPGIVDVMTLGGAFEFSGWLFRSSFGSLDQMRCMAPASSSIFRVSLSTVIASIAPHHTVKFSFLTISLFGDFTAVAPQPSPLRVHNLNHPPEGSQKRTRGRLNNWQDTALMLMLMLGGYSRNAWVRAWE